MCTSEISLSAQVRAMQQVKIFKAVDTEIPDMEHQINRWMRKSGAKIISITGNLASQPAASGGPMNSFAAGDILIVVLYEIDSPAKRSSKAVKPT